MAQGDPATIEGITAAWQETTEALRESERRYRELVECSLGLICTHDLTGTILSINSASATSLGYQPGHGVGRNLREFLSPDKRHLFDDYLRRIQEQGHDAGMMSVVASDGTTRVWMYRNVLSRRQDGTAYVLGHAIDVTDRVAVERVSGRTSSSARRCRSWPTFRIACLRSSRSKSWSKSCNACRCRSSPIPRWCTSPTTTEPCGLRRRMQAAARAGAGWHGGRVDANGWHGDDDRATWRVYGHTCAARCRRQGQSGPVAGLGHRTAARASGPFVVDEMARRIRLALDRIQLYREAQEANRLKDEFLSTLSHELRTPLNAIFGWARILRARHLDPSTAHAVEVIERNAEAQIRLIEEVLDVSRIITGKMTLAAEAIDIRVVVRAAIDMVRPGMHAKRIRLEERIDEVPTVVGDGHRLQQVFWNLLSNALKFTGEDGTITVSLRDAPPHVEFEIADTGVGIRRDVLPFVFDRFRQADSSMKRTHGGLGLGLAIVRHIVELHGGTVRAVSEGEGYGASFVIRLPSAARAMPDVARTATSSPSTTAPALRGRTILVVEDHDDARDLIASVLDGAGGRVLAASTTAEGLAHARRERPDVLLADLGLPGEDGYVLLARFRAIYPDVPAIALTAYARATDRRRALAAGFAHHVIKPVDPNQLVDLIVKVIEQ